MRRAVAIQLIINRELGLNKNQNPWQGSFLIDQLTDLVEEAVYQEFDRIAERGGVLGAMETMYQRGRSRKRASTTNHASTTARCRSSASIRFCASGDAVEEVRGAALIRSSEEEKQGQVTGVRDFQARHAQESAKALERLQAVAAGARQRFRGIDGDRKGLLAGPDLARTLRSRRAVSPQRLASPMPSGCAGARGSSSASRSGSPRSHEHDASRGIAKLRGRVLRARFAAAGSAAHRR